MSYFVNSWKAVQFILIISALSVTAEWTSWLKVTNNICHNCTSEHVLGLYVKLCKKSPCKSNKVHRYVIEKCFLTPECQKSQMLVPKLVYACSVTCGLGTLNIYHERKCDGEESCEEPRVKNVSTQCIIDMPCPSDGGWSHWSRVYGPCLRNCSRKITLMRTCTFPAPYLGKPCVGVSEKSVMEKCLGDSCVREYGEWSSWHRVQKVTCEKNCKPKAFWVNYTRTCLTKGLQCNGNAMKILHDYCYVDEKCYPLGGWTFWSKVRGEGCHAMCGMKSVVEYYIRDCVIDRMYCLGRSKRRVVEPCPVIDPCPVHGSWSTWRIESESRCQENCQQYITHVRECSNPTPQYGGRMCVGPSVKVETNNCEGDSCLEGDRIWSDWVVLERAMCSATCDSGIRNILSRRDYREPNFEGTKMNRVKSQFKIFRRVCKESKCQKKHDSPWTVWESVGTNTCPAVCGVGKRPHVQSRRCLKKQCRGSFMQEEYVWCESGRTCTDLEGWSAWEIVKDTGCLVTCEIGFRAVYFSRTCVHAPCYGSASRRILEKCYSVLDCPVNGGWGSWTKSTETGCSVTCGRGMVVWYAKRRCDNPKFRSGGADCIGLPFKMWSEKCQKGKCTIGEWSQWQIHLTGRCPKCSAVRLTERAIRTCQTKNCVGNSFRLSIKWCKPDRKCPGIGGWSPWKVSNESRCLVTCGFGLRVVSLVRKCLKTPCEGPESKQVQDFCDNKRPCQGMWSEWEIVTNSSCHSDCVWNVTLKRECVDKTYECYGLTVANITQICYNGKCPNAWLPWKTTEGECSTTCGYGFRTVSHNRTCRSEDKQNCVGIAFKSEYKVCKFDVACPVKGHWSRWTTLRMSDCSVTCSQGIIHLVFERLCNNPVPLHGGKMCIGDSMVTKTMSCFVYAKCSEIAITHQIGVMPGVWSGWIQNKTDSQCRQNCKQLTILNRKCRSFVRNAKTVCMGNKNIIVLLNCRGEKCRAVDGAWTTWQPRTVVCSVTEGYGTYQIYYRRFCSNPKPSKGGWPCAGHRKKLVTGLCSSALRIRRLGGEGEDAQAVEGAWSDWEFRQKTKCSARCESTHTFIRFCELPGLVDLGRLMCSGNDQTQFIKRCADGECQSLNGQWTSWFKTYADACHDICVHRVTMMRTCTNPPPQGDGQYCQGDDVTIITVPCKGQLCVDGQWSPWETVKTAACLVSCNQSVELNRSCTNPSPSAGGDDCAGNTTLLTYQPCTGDMCKSVYTRQKDSPSYVILIANALVVVVLVTACYIYAKIRAMKQGEKEENEDVGQKRMMVLSDVLGYAGLDNRGLQDSSEISDDARSRISRGSRRSMGIMRGISSFISWK